MFLEQNSKIEVAAFVEWVQGQNTGDGLAVKNWINTNGYQGKPRVYESVDHLKTCAHFHGPMISDAQINSVVAAFHAAQGG